VDIAEQQVGEITIVEVKGRIDSNTAKAFGERLTKLINASRGGTRIEPWISPEGYRRVPALADIAENLDRYPEKNEGGGIDHQSPLALFNRMIHPLIPFAIRGLLWYQGEQNRTEGMVYRDKMQALIEGWRAVWNQACASCHSIESPLIGQVTSVADVGTDPQRLNSFTPELARSMNTIGEGKPWRFSHFRKTDGYANMPLDGLWLRAPFLHNGSVPTLRALLYPDERPAVFYRSYDVYDWTNVGFVATGAEAEASGVRFDTSLKGNSNAGHTYGATLSREQRELLLEYLKTL